MKTRTIAAAAALLALVTACSSVPTMPAEGGVGLDAVGYPATNGSEGDSGLGIGSGRQIDETGATGSESGVDVIGSESRDGGLGIGTG